MHKRIYNQDSAKCWQQVVTGRHLEPVLVVRQTGKLLSHKEEERLHCAHVDDSLDGWQVSAIEDLHAQRGYGTTKQQFNRLCLLNLEYFHDHVKKGACDLEKHCDRRSPKSKTNAFESVRDDELFHRFVDIEP